MTATNSSTRVEIRTVLGAHASLSVDITALADDADLFQAGMTSFTSVNVMLALEDAFDIEFPDEMLKRETFTSVNSIADVVDSLAATA